MRGYVVVGLGLLIGFGVTWAGEDAAVPAATQAQSKPATQPAEDYSGFSRLPNITKDRIIWQLYEDKKWGRPEQKPICQDILATQASYSANAIAWTTGAIDLSESQKWTDSTPLILGIYRRPQNIWVYERAFQYLRKRQNRPIPADLVAAADTLARSGQNVNDVTDGQVKAAQDRLLKEPDKEAALVYLVNAAGWHAGKGSTYRGRKAAAEVLRKMDQGMVDSRVRQLYSDSDEPQRSEIKWLAMYLKVDTSTVPLRKFPQIDALHDATQKPGGSAASQPATQPERPSPAR